MAQWLEGDAYSWQFSVPTSRHSCLTPVPKDVMPLASWAPALTSCTTPRHPHSLKQKDKNF